MTREPTSSVYSTTKRYAVIEYTANSYKRKKPSLFIDTRYFKLKVVSIVCFLVLSYLHHTFVVGLWQDKETKICDNAMLTRYYLSPKCYRICVRYGQFENTKIWAISLSEINILT